MFSFSQSNFPFLLEFFPANWIRVGASLKIAYFSIDRIFSRNDSRWKRRGKKMKRDDTPFFPISHLFERVHLFVVSTVAIRSVRHDNNWIHLEKLSRAEERRGGGRREGAFVACIEKIASWNTLRTCNVYWRARNIAIFFSPNILQSFYFLISVKLIVVEFK